MKHLEFQDIKNIIDSNESKQRIKDVLNGINNENDRDELGNWLQQRIDPFLKRCEIVTDKEEIPWVVMWYYVQLKAEWSQINTEIQYGALNNGAPDMKLVFKSSLLSALIAITEEIPRAADVEYATNFLSEPFSKLLDL